MNRTIALVDDDEDMIKILSYQLRKSGFTVFTAHNGLQAEKLLETETPSLTILDYQMPGVDGLQVCRWMRDQERLRKVPILFLTARADFSQELIAPWNQVEYLLKPYDFPLPLEKIQKHLRT